MIKITAKPEGLDDKTFEKQVKEFNNGLKALKALDRKNYSEEELLQALDWGKKGTEQKFIEQAKSRKWPAQRIGPHDYGSYLPAVIPIDLDKASDELSVAAIMFVRRIKFGFKKDIEAGRMLKNLILMSERYADALNKALGSKEPESLKYKGVLVLNPERLAESSIRPVLDGLDYALALFKKRGVLPILKDSLKSILIRSRESGDKMADGGEALGYYNSSKKQVIILSDAPSFKNPRFLKRWVDEIFVHELGHHVHMSLLHPVARHEWDKAWLPVKELKEKKRELIKKVVRVTFEERKRFFDMLVKANFELKKIKLKSLDRMKFHAWLREPLVQGPLVTEKQLRWTKEGTATVERLKIYLQNAEEWEGGYDNAMEALKGRLGLESNHRHYTDNKTMKHPTLYGERLKDYFKSDNEVLDSQIKSIINKLMIPSEYGKTNELEDFAETFVVYMDAPEKLSEQAKYRIQRALHQSGLHGKPILRRVGASVEAALLTAATVPLPSSFEDGEAGLMTLSEFIKHLNPEDKMHPSTAYNFRVADLNKTLSGLASRKNRFGDWDLLGPYLGKGTDRVVKKDGDVVAVLVGDTLYTSLRSTEVPRIPTVFFEMGREKEFRLPEFKRVKRVKYPSEYISKVSNVAKRNLENYPYLINNIKVKGEPLQIRAEGKPVKNKQQTIAILNQNGEKVAFAADEWGATLLAVTKEYQRRGLGDILLKLWYEFNPRFKSGGTTPAGLRANQRLWENRVSEFLSNGWYSELVKQKKMSPSRVKEILGDLSPSARKSVRLPSEEAKQPEKKQLLVYVDDPKEPVSFVLYDARFLSDPEADKAEDYIHAYGFFRDSEHAPAPFLYQLDYDRKHAALAHRIAFQMARQNKEKIWVGETYGDILELDNIPGVKVEDNLAWVEKDVFPLRQAALQEKAARKPRDKYGELETLLLEAAEAKWR